MNSELEHTIAASPMDAIRGPFYVLKLAADTKGPADSVCLFWDKSETTAIIAQRRGEGAPEVGGSVLAREGPFSILRLRVAQPFVARGFLAAATSALADEAINVYLLSTFSFDFVLVRAELLDRSVVALSARGFPHGEVQDVW